MDLHKTRGFWSLAGGLKETLKKKKKKEKMKTEESEREEGHQKDPLLLVPCAHGLHGVQKV